jgi:hypothetical protein
VQLPEKPDEVLKAAAQPIDAPRGHHVKFAPGDRLVQPIECGPLVASVGAADAVVAELGDHAPAAPLDRRFQVAPLVLDRLPTS